MEPRAFRPGVSFDPMREVSRREFVLGSAAGLLTAGGVQAQPVPLTAQGIIERLQADLGPSPTGTTVDGFKAGNPSIVVAGVVISAMATMDVLRRAGQARLVISYEPVFYTANDDPGARASDPIYLAKKKFVEENRLVVYRLFDRWNARRPDAFARTIAASLSGAAVAGADRVYDVPDTTLGALAETNRLPGMRLVGDRAMRVRRVFISPGTTTLAATMAGLRHADAVIAGEPREWEAVPYVSDCIAADQSKGMILLGRIVSEPSAVMFNWVRSVVPELQVTDAGVTDPYWKA